MLRYIERAVAVFLITVTMMVGTATVASAEGWRFDECRYQSLDPGTWTPREVRLVIRCAAIQWDVPSGVDKAIRVASCESGLRPRAYNPNGYAGLFQQSTRYWPGRNHSPPGWDKPLHESVFNARSNAVVSARMAGGANSWSAWAGCADA